MTPTTEKLPISVLILAGGRGSRMGGRDKGLVELNNQPFVEHALKIVRPFSDDIIISCNRNQAQYRNFSDTLVTDKNDDFPGPLAGIQAGLQHAKHAAMLVLPCDTPMIPTDLPQQLYQSFRNNPDAISLVNDGERLQPLHAIIPTQYRQSLNQFLEGDRRGVIRWYKQHPVKEVVYQGQAEFFTNINRLEELEAINQQLTC
ncbi:MAG: molybdenum cofactor guanylyltransferase MobA [Motiliproteus sp.]|nr:molybdenum cofactor guanylyltransferase MobA [Motiliproteus sp.]